MELKLRNANVAIGSSQISVLSIGRWSKFDAQPHSPSINARTLLIKYPRTERSECSKYTFGFEFDSGQDTRWHNHVHFVSRRMAGSGRQCCAAPPAAGII